MLRLRPDRWQAWLGPKRSRLAVSPAGRGRVPTARTIDSPAAAGAPAWANMAPALEVLLEQQPEVRRLRVLLDDALLHYVTIPWSDTVRTDEERTALARIRLRELFGPVIDGCAVRSCMSGYGRAGIACGVPQALLDAVREIAERRGCSVTSIRPQFMQALDDVAVPAHIHEFLLVSATDDGALLAHHASEGWISVRHVRADRGDIAAVLVAARRTLALGGAEETVPVYMHATQRPERAPAVAGGHPVVWPLDVRPDPKGRP